MAKRNPKKRELLKLPPKIKYEDTENEQYFQNASVIVNLTLFDLMVILI